MRKARLFAHDPKGVIPRMSWSPHNLYNLINRSMPSYAAGASFKKTSMTMYQQRWRSKRLLRGYHGDWIREKQFKRWYLPVDLPNLKSKLKIDTEIEQSSEERMPISSLFLRDVERRLDTVVFRCCFARSAREARALVVQGKVQVNGAQVKLSGFLLKPGDLISVRPDAVPMLSKEMEKQAEIKAAAVMAGSVERENTEGAEKSEEALSTSLEGEEEASSEQAQIQGGEVAQEEAASEVGTEAATEADATNTADARQESEQENLKEETAVKSQDKVGKIPRKESLAPGVFPFNLPSYATPFLFIPPYLEVSYTTCSAIYMRHPTITPTRSAAINKRRYEAAAASPPSIVYRTDIPSPYPAGGDIFSLAWEYYNKNAPRTRSDLRRLKLEAKVGGKGMQTARAKDEYKKVRAIRRGYDRVEKGSGSNSFIVGALGKERRGKVSRSSRLLERGQSGEKNIASLQARA